MENKIYYDSPVGWLEIRSVDEEITGLDYRESPGEAAGDSDVLKQCTEELREYFEGGRTTFDVPLNLSYKGTEFQRKVWNALREIPYGRTISYKELAVMCGGANYSRAVANANGKNPISIIVPCHRVISSDGTLGGYTGGLDRKSRLLTIEGLQLM